MLEDNLYSLYENQTVEWQLDGNLKKEKLNLF